MPNVTFPIRNVNLAVEVKLTSRLTTLLSLALSSLSLLVSQSNVEFLNRANAVTAIRS